MSFIYIDMSFRPVFAPEIKRARSCRLGEQALFCGAREVLFLLEQRVLAFEAPAVAGQVAVLPDDAMARNHDGNRIRGAGASDGANRSGLADGSGDFGVRARGAVGDAAKLVPDAT